MPDAASANGQPGSHWAAVVVYPQRKMVVYKSSLTLQNNAAEALQVGFLTLKPHAICTDWICTHS